MQPISVNSIRAIQLQHKGECNLLGVTVDLHAYVEEIYTDETWMAQHIVNLDGELIQTIDEDYGRNPNVNPLDLPAHIKTPHACQQTCALSFSGPRLRGLRAEERIDLLVRSVSILQKMALVKRLNLDIMPPMLLGLAESYVLSEAALIPGEIYCVCRRLRFAYVLQHPGTDADGNRYDYDTMLLHVAHIYRLGDEDPYLAGEPDVLAEQFIKHPTDCVFHDGYLFITDSAADNEQINQLHIMDVDIST